MIAHPASVRAYHALSPELSKTKLVLSKSFRGHVVHTSESHKTSTVEFRGVRTTQRKNTCRWFSLESLYQARYSSKVPSKTIDLVPSSGARFTHETRDFLTGKTVVAASFRQVNAFIQNDWGGNFAPRSEESFLMPRDTTDSTLMRFN